MQVKYAGFWVRASALVIDSLLLTLIAWVLELLILGIAFWVEIYLIRSGKEVSSYSAFMESMNAFWLQILNLVLYGIAAIPYYVWWHYKWGTTIGKKRFKVYVVNASDYAPITLKQSWIRCLAYFISYLPFGCGYLMAAFQPEKKGLHDLLAGTVSIIKPVSESVSV